MTDESSGSSSGGGLQTRILSTFLNELDGIVAQDCGIEGTISFLILDMSSVLSSYSLSFNIFTIDWSMIVIFR